MIFSGLPMARPWLFGPGVHGEQPPAVGGRGDHRRGTQPPAQQQGQGVGAADVARDQWDGKAAVFIQARARPGPGPCAADGGPPPAPRCLPPPRRPGPGTGKRPVPSTGPRGPLAGRPAGCCTANPPAPGTAWARSAKAMPRLVKAISPALTGSFPGGTRW